ncbi:MAG: DEAD/DEAH box helicase [Actinomycetia bacterium]|nr:DEAD/DEAH box helicase [Actinomycetes bacterium]MCP4084750.1 DEAD/DEAH box helicase [Actinomycetes bacterium]
MNEQDQASANGFADLGLRPEILGTLEALGYREPTPIQKETIPPLLGGADVLGQAATGTGKTAAFALPVVNQIEADDPKVPVALVLVPTRELAVQVSDAMLGYGQAQRIKVVAIYGGQPIHHQLQAIDRGVHIIVATPGRARDHLERGSLSLDTVRTVILDEADEMLDMGFSEDLEAILERTPSERQTVLFSATLPPRINSIAKRFQRDPVRIQIARTQTSDENTLVRQAAFLVQRQHKPAALGRILDIENPQSALVFCKTRTDVDELTVNLNARGYRAEALHGGMDQRQRDRVMARLRDGTAELLVATDVAARGLDVDTLTHVVNFDVPSAPASYVHRIGRVGRAGREGVAITLVEPRNRRQLANIEQVTKTKIAIEQVPSVADLRARQVEYTLDAVRQALTGEDVDDYSATLDRLTETADERTVALAAIKLVHEARNPGVDEVEIPAVSDRPPKRDKGPKVNKGDRPRGGKGDRPHSKGPAGSVYIGLGRKASIRPGDLVGAIANETGLAGREIGPIRITDRYSVVGVPEGSVDQVIKALQSTTIRGKRTTVRRFVE